MLIKYYLLCFTLYFTNTTSYLFKILNYLYSFIAPVYMGMHICRYACHRACVDFREELVGVSLFYFHMVPGEIIHALHLGCVSLHLLSFFLVPTTYIQYFDNFI